MKTMMSVEEASELIRAGKKLLVAGDGALLSALPMGDWVGGTTPYFMSEEGAMCSHDLVQAIVLPEGVASVKARLYAATELKSIPQDYLPNGFAVVLIPSFTEAHTTFAKDSSSWPDVFSNPLMGWITGVDFADLGKIKPQVFNGQTGEASETKAAVLHVELHEHLMARVHTVCLFQAGEGDAISFPVGGFEVSDCVVNGEKLNFAEYMTARNLDVSAPIVGNHFGAMVHVSLAKVDKEAGKVSFYAPVFPGLRYRFAARMENYPAEYAARLGGRHSFVTNSTYSCNCLVNYFAADLEGKKTGDLQGPIVYGEIAYMLLNQTIIYLTIEPK